MTATGVNPLIGQSVDGRYLVESHLADGGMGSVYLALDTRLDRRVALKVLREDLARDQGFVERFRREARSAARLSHPNIVGVYDQGGGVGGMDGGPVWLVMELVGDGRTLRTWLGEVGALTPREALEVWAAMLRALSAAHRAGILHRDVKPENVLLGPGPDDGAPAVIKVADFGLSRPITTQTFTNAGTSLLGTASYLAPEQIETGHADERSDLYAAGLVLSEMLTGRKAVTGDTLIQVAYQHVHGTVPLPSEAVPGLPDELDALCAWASQRDPDARPADAATLLAQLDASAAALTDAQLDARPAVEGFDAVAADTSRLVQPTRRVPLVPPPAKDSGTTAGTTAGAAGPATSDPARSDGVAGLPPTSGVVLPAGASLPSKLKRLSGPRRPLKPWARWFLGAFATALLIGGTVYWYLFLGPAGTRVVPDVTKAAQGEATLLLAAQDLDAAITPAFSEDIPRGRVISTDPAPGVETKRGRDVTVFVSNGPERHEVPAVAKLSPDAAANLLMEHKLTRGTVAEEYSETVEAGLVTRADPATGTSLRPNTPVNLWVSKGRQPITVPKLVGKPLQDAQNELARLGLKAKVDKREFSNDVPKDSIITQAPARGTIYRDGTITLTVSKGPDLIPVPNVTGKNEAEAVAMLKAAGFNVEVRRELGGIFGTAHSTDPAGGGQAGRGSTVILKIV